MTTHHPRAGAHHEGEGNSGKDGERSRIALPVPVQRLSLARDGRASTAGSTNAAHAGRDRILVRLRLDRTSRVDCCFRVLPQSAAASRTRTQSRAKASSRILSWSGRG